MNKIFNEKLIEKCTVKFLPNRVLFAMGDTDEVECASLWISKLEKQIAALKKENDYFRSRGFFNPYKDEVEKLKSVIERGDEIKNNWENKCYQEAAHYNWLDDKNEKLEQEVAELKKYKAAYEVLSEANEKINYENLDDKTHVRYIEALKKWQAKVIKIKSEATAKVKEILK